jgi:hypothetical protein
MDEYEIEARKVALLGLQAAADFLRAGNGKGDAFSRAHRKAQVGVQAGASYVRYLSAKNNARLLDLNEERIRHDLANHNVPALPPVVAEAAD